MHPKKVIVFVQGGLGNQLFCYAIARSYSLQYGRNCALDTYTGYINDQYQRVCRLNAFNLFGGLEEGVPSQSILSKISKFLPLKFRSLVKEKNIGNATILKINFVPNSIYFEGYWQSEKYFKSIKNILIQELEPNIKLSAKDKRVLAKISTTNSVFIHVRRLQYSHQLPLSYYEQAIVQMKQTLTNPTFFVFGDDMEWVGQNEIFTNNCEAVTHNNGENEMHDFLLMKHCQHAIIANSSFSWWAAWLKNNENQKVICPNRSGFGLEMSENWQAVKVKYQNIN